MNGKGRDVRYGLALGGSWPLGVPTAELLFRVAERAEALGFDALWTGDHIIMNVPNFHSLSTLAMLAARTRHVTVGCAVLILPLHHPVIIAKVASTIDYLSGGRLILGVGVGGEIVKEWEVVGAPLRGRGRRADEGIELMRRLWRDEHASFQGECYQFSDATMAPQPAQPGGPPIWIGGRSDAALLRAARLGDGWVSYVVTPERFREGIAKIEEYAAANGRGLGDFAKGHLLFIQADDDRERARRTAVEALSLRYKQPFDKLVDKYCAYGSVADCAETVARFVEAGANHVILSPVCRVEELEEQVERYGSRLLPMLRGG